MKKITLGLLMFCCFAFSLQINAQFAESFETEIPASWTVINNGSPTGWEYYSTPTGGAQDGTSVARILYDSSTAHDDYLITPGITVASGVNDRFSLYVKSRSSAFLEPYEILLSTTDTNAASFNVVLQASSEAPNTWTPLTFDLSAYVGDTVYIAVHATGTNEWELYVDNAISDAIPACPAPTDLAVSDMIGTTANLGWTDNAGVSLWDIELVDITGGGSASGAPTVSGVSNPYEAMSLVSGNDYEFYVRADCGGDGTSEWAGPFAFTFYPAPDCPIAPVFPVDGATDVSVGDITATWTAPATGPTPTEYNFYAVDDETGANPQLIGTVATTSIDLNILAYEATIYWMVTSLNGTTESSSCAVYSFTTEANPGYCLTAVYGQYPAATYDATAATCDGTTPNDVTTNAWASEYALVTVESGQTYQFSSSVATDFITISNADGTAAIAYGTSPVTWTSNVDGDIRFYAHVNDQCDSEDTGRVKSILCGSSLGLDDVSLSQFTYFPNPVNDKLTLNAQSNIQNVAVYNMLGQEVINASPNTLDAEVDMVNLNSGAYFVKVTIDNATKTIRVIKN